MPSPRILDFGEHPLAPAARGFGAGFGNQLFKDYETSQQEDALQNLLSNLNPNANPEDAIKDIFGAKGVSFDQKKQIHGALDDVRKQARTIKEKEIEDAKNAEIKKKLLKAGLPESLADLYSDATTGGRTELIKTLRDYYPDVLNTLINGEDAVQDLMAVQDSPEAGLTPAAPPQNLPNASVGATETPQQRLNYKPQDFDRNLSIKDRTTRQENRFRIQSPVLMKNGEQIKALESEIRSLDNLDALSDQVGTKIADYAVNPWTGQLIAPGLSSVAAQKYQKGINDFTTRAKDTYGARVTNFELDTFLKRLPTLANSAMGRKAIIKQMKIVDQINLLEKQAIDDVVAAHGGIRNIDWADAERIAHKVIQPEVKKLEDEYRKASEWSDNFYKDKLARAKENLPTGRVMMLSPEGKLQHWPSKNVKSLQDKGYTLS